MRVSEWLQTVTRYDPWDVVVIGGGPAGAVAARQIARQLHHVLLIEKSRIPRFKVCGGCLGGAALDVLENIGLGDLPAKCGGVQLRRMRLASAGCVANFPIGRRIALSRETFDAALIREAIQARATVCAETKGSLTASDECGLCQIKLQCNETEVLVRAKAVLIATGLSSCEPHCTTTTCPKSRIGLGTLLEQPHGYVTSDILQMACTSSGYVGIAPIDGWRIDLAAAVDPAALAAARSPGRLICRMISEAGLPAIAGLEGAEWRGTPLLTRHTRPLATNRCLILGDAAEYVEPFTGEGIGWAMESAVLASTLIQQGLEVWTEEIAERWERLYKRTLIRRQRSCRLTSWLLRNSTLRNVAVWTLRWAPFLASPVVRQLDRPFKS
jgi:menaquinone-9 beta-reductase